MKKLLAGLILSAALLNAQSIVNINLNETDLEVGVDNMKNYSKNTKIYNSIAFINAEDENENAHSMVEGEIMLIGLTPLPGFSAGLGVKAIAATFDDLANDDLTATGLGIKLKGLYTLPLIIKSYLTGSYVYAPSALTFSDLDNYTEFRLNLDVEIIDGGMVYVGYRDMELEFDGYSGSYEYNNATYVGVKFVIN